MKKLFWAIFLLSLTFGVPVPQSHAAQTGKPAAAKPAGKKAAQATATVKEKKTSAASRQRARRAHRAFIASADLKSMARQLLENRTPAAYAGVEAYARRHAGTDVGGTSQLVLGYARVLDRDYTKALAPLKKAKTHAGELDDYVAYFLAVAQEDSGDHEGALVTLRDFDDRYRDSIFVRDAALLRGTALLALDRAPEAISLLGAHRTPPRADFELALGRAYLRTNDTKQAVDTLRHLYYTMPLAPEADVAQTLLVSISDAPPPTFAERKQRADLLQQARRSRDAADAYRELLAEAQPEDRPELQVALGLALYRSDSDKEARELLEGVTATSSELNCQRLYTLAEIARSENDDAHLSDVLAQLRQAGPTSSWLEQTLLSTGNKYLLAKDYDRAIDFYREVHERFPNGRYAAYTHWKTAWLTLRQGRTEQAAQAFEQHIALYPGSPQVPAALYWRARLADDAGDPARARLWYRKVVERFPNYYYADLARAGLEGRKVEADVQAETDAEPLLQKVAPTQLPVNYEAHAPADDLRYEKSLLLRNAGMFDFAAKELQLAAAGDGATWAAAEMARLYQDAGQYHRALQTLKRAVPTYYSLGMEALPRFYWETLFPRPYWSDLTRFSARNRLDPFLVASLIRQESEFNPEAVSRANAMGLMQLLPGTGRITARELRVRRFSTSQLLTPNVNLRLGTTYFRQLLDKFDGRLEYALAAYNAGTDRVEGWLQDGNFRDPAEFVESIPFTETREYVQAILRNASVYRRLYAAPPKKDGARMAPHG